MAVFWACFVVLCLLLLGFLSFRGVWFFGACSFMERFFRMFALFGLFQSKMDSTPHCSRVVPHPSTERAQTALTSVFG